ncbi:MAG: hypothetical protein FJ011_04240 [Chloroflexi bacterium]|nr:hypothetical protein [Chloroflexota bacterium]
MAPKQPYTWNPSEVIEVTNTSAENVLLELDSGRLRLDAGRTLRLTASALEVSQLTALINAGKIKAHPFRLK